ncbi:TPA: hypothetical protein GF101_25205 [Citrobacter rodentium]|nr:hypothetical protein [Citrobacter rodentium]
MNTNTIFELYPQVGINNVKFGMSPEQVAMELGDPEEVWVNENNELVEERAHLNITYTALDKELCHFGFGKKMNHVMFSGVNVFHSKPDKIIKKMMTIDDKPYFFVGSIFFMKLGISLSGFYDEDEDEDEDDKAIALYNHHDYDDLLPQMELFTDMMKREYNKDF